MKYLRRKDNFREIIKRKKVLVVFFADWNGPCKSLDFILDEIDKEQKNLTILKVNTEEYLSLSQEYGVLTIPNLKLFQKGSLIREHIGFIKKEDLLEFIN